MAEGQRGTERELREEPFPSRDGTRLFHAWMLPPAPKAVVLVVHGYGDHALRYRHVLEALVDAGYAAHAIDYRGHGQAEGRRGHVARFPEYLDDLRSALDRVRMLHPGKPLFLLGHSHGALVISSLLLSSDPPADVRGVVFTSPYFRLKIVPSAFQLFLANVVGKVIPHLQTKPPLSVEMLTRDKDMVEATRRDPLYQSVVTPRWFTESNAAQAALFQEAGRFRQPLLVLQGGDDAIADPDGARDFVGAAGSVDKTLTVYSGMFHEVLNEIDRVRVIADMVAWLDARVMSGETEAA